nr:DMT family transporter [Desulfuromonadales bacterium]NIS43236.1 DMT family transporter [Desulfuromonadales bacterium]
MAVCYPAIKAGLPHAPPLRFGGLRTLIGGIFLLLIAILTKRPVIPGTRLILWIVPLAIVSTSLTYAFMFSSPAFIDAGVASVLGNTQPLFIAGFAVLVLGEMMSRTKLAALSLGFLGVVILTAPAMSDTNPVNLTGALLALGTSASAALASVWMKWLRPRSCLLALTGWQLSVGGLILLACSAIWEPNSAVRWSGSLVALLMVLAVFGTALATLLWYWCLQHREA